MYVCYLRVYVFPPRVRWRTWLGWRNKLSWH